MNKGHKEGTEESIACTAVWKNSPLELKQHQTAKQKSSP